MTRPDDNANVTFNGKTLFDGAAEYTHGIDDFRKYTIDNSFNEAMIDDAMTTNRSTSDQEKPYVVGYAFLHYLNAKSGHDGMAMKRMMSELVAKGGSQAGLDAAVAAASKGGFATEAEAISSFKADFKAAGDAKTFLKRYCDIDTSDESDTGSATPTWRRK